LIGRLVCGLSVGLNSAIVPLFINEVSPIELNGVTGTMNQVGICMGVLTSYLLGYLVPYTTSTSTDTDNVIWRIILVVPGFTAMLRIFLLSTFFSYDTPKYLVFKGDDDRARQVLARIYTPNFATEQLMMLKKEKEAETMAGNKLTFSELFTKKYSRRLFVGCGLSALQQLSGINALITFSNQVFIGTSSSEPSESNFDTARTYTVLFGSINLLTPLIASGFMTKVGRKTLLITGNIVCMICLLIFPITALPAIIQKLSVFVYTIGFGFSLGPIVWLYNAEILPDIGIGIAVLVNWVCAMLVVQTFTLLSGPLGDSAFLIFFGFCVIGLFFLIVFVKETKDKTAAEIEEMYTPVEDESTSNSKLLKRDS